MDEPVPLRALLSWTVLVVSDEEPLSILPLTSGYSTAVQHSYGGQPVGRCSGPVLHVLTEYSDDDVAASDLLS